MGKDQPGRDGRIKVQPVRKERPDVRALVGLFLDLGLSDAELPEVRDASTTSISKKASDQQSTRRSA